MRAQTNAVLSAQIVATHQETREAYSSRRLWKALRDKGVACGRHRVDRLRRRARLITKRRDRFLRSRSAYQRVPTAPRLITWPFVSPHPNRIWAADISLIPTREGWLYLGVVMDVHSRKVIGWAMANAPDQDLALNALKMAIARRQPPPGVIHHSDQGVQYTCHAYQALLRQQGMHCSMSRKAMPYDNAVVERFFSSLKQELVHHERFVTRDVARSALFEYIEVFYNRQRLHSSLGYRSPEQFEALQCVA
jgi:putative transposase